VAWRAAQTALDVPSLYAALVAAASSLGHVQVVELSSATAPEPIPVDAVVVDDASPRDAALQGSPLVVALARGASTGDHVHTLAHDADLVLSPDVHGRFLLATILALLRWRAR